MAFPTVLDRRRAGWPVQVLVLLLAAAVAFAGRASGAELGIVVLVNDEPISAFDVEQRLRLMAMTSGKEPSAALRKQVIDELVSERLQLQEAKKLGIAIEEDRIAAILANVAQNNNMTKDQLVAGLNQRGINIRTFEQRIRAQLVWRGVVQRKFRHQVSVSATQIDEALSTSEGGSETTEIEYQRVELEIGGDAAQRDLAGRLVEADELRQRFGDCKAIADLVKRVRRTTIKDTVRKTAEQIPQPSRALLMKAKVGEMTPPNITATGVELYAVCARRSIRSNTEERQALAQKLEEQEYQRLASRYLQDLRRDAYIEYRQ